MTESQKSMTFQYTYSAKEQEELNRIRSRYLPKEEDKLERLRRLDARTTRKANISALIAGVTGALALGAGMSCCMVWADRFFGAGIVIGLAGMAAAALAYPLYHRILRRERERAAPEILRLTDELMQ